MPLKPKPDTGFPPPEDDPVLAALAVAESEARLGNAQADLAEAQARLARAEAGRMADKKSDDQLIDLPREPGLWLCRVNLGKLEGPPNAILEIAGQPPHLKPFIHGLGGDRCPAELNESLLGKHRIRLGPRLLPDQVEQEGPPLTTAPEEIHVQGRLDRADEETKDMIRRSCTVAKVSAPDPDSPKS